MKKEKIYLFLFFLIFSIISGILIYILFKNKNSYINNQKTTNSKEILNEINFSIFKFKTLIPITKEAKNVLKPIKNLNKIKRNDLLIKTIIHVYFPNLLKYFEIKEYNLKKLFNFEKKIIINPKINSFKIIPRINTTISFLEEMNIYYYIGIYSNELDIKKLIDIILDPKISKNLVKWNMFRIFSKIKEKKLNSLWKKIKDHLIF